MSAFNDRLAIAITRRVGTMWTAYLFALLSLVSLPAVIRSGDPVLIVAWISQAFLQLVLLPIIMVGQKLQGDHVAEQHEQTRAHIDNHVAAIHKKLDR